MAKRTLNILHVEDNIGDALLLKEILSDADEFHFNITLAESLSKAMKELDNNNPDIILLDLGLPDSIEMQALDVMLEKNREVPILVITGMDDKEAGRNAVKSGAQSYLSKNELNSEYIIQSIIYSVERKKQLNRISRTENELKEKNSALEEVNASKDRLLSIISHDLRSPMSGVAGLLSILNDEYDLLDDAKRKEYIKVCYDNTSNTYNLIETLLSWAQSQSNRRKVNPHILNIHKISEDSTLPHLEIAKSKGVRLKNTVNPDQLIYADQEMICTIIRNLVSNAIKFSSEGDVVEIGSNQQGDSKVLIYIKDQGIGIEEKNLKKVLDIREGFTTPGTENEKGTGFGIILCKEFVEKNNGELWIESEEGNGTTVYFTLPAREQD